MESRIDKEQRELVRVNFQAITETGTLDVWDLDTQVDGTAADITLTLPAVQKAIGKIYTITLEDADSKTLTITDAGDDTIFTDLELGDDNDYAVLFSNGTRWFVLVSVTD